MTDIAQSVQDLIDSEFKISEDYIFLNHAAVSPWPQRTTAAVERFARENLVFGPIHYPEWLEVENELRRQLASLIRAPSPDDIALLKNTSEGLSLVAYGLDWASGDNIVSSNQEFPSNRVVWESLSDRGVELRQVELVKADSTPEAELEAACDARTRLLAVSSVQFATGLTLDLQRLGRFCRQRGILFCIDAIQSIGAVDMDLRSLEADFIVADGHKWMLGPEGLALFYCRAELREQLHLHQYGWHMLENSVDFDQRAWRPAASAQRFECGSPNMLGIHALSASVGLLLEAGMSTIERLVRTRADFLATRLQTIEGLRIRDDRFRRSGIVAFEHTDTPGVDLFRGLQKHNIICALRGGLVRFSPHFYTQESALEQAVGHVRALTGR
jgi:selenocysteine lyase/cysteine desulfurase